MNVDLDQFSCYQNANNFLFFLLYVWLLMLHLYFNASEFLQHFNGSCSFFYAKLDVGCSAGP